MRTDTVKNALVPNLNILSERSKSIIQNRMAMRHTKQLQHNLNINDLCLMRYSIGDEKKSLLTTVLEVDEFSDYHPVKMVCKVDTDALAALENGISVSLVSKKSNSKLFVLLKGSVFQTSLHEGYVVLSITNVQFFTREEKNNISSFIKIENLSVLSAA